MKKFLLVLALSGCVLGMTACGSEEADSPLVVNEQLTQNTDAIFEIMDEAVTKGEVEMAAEQFDVQYGDGVGDEFIAACGIWEGSVEETGAYKGIVEDSMKIEGTVDEFTVSFEIEGSNRNADVELYYTEDTILFPDMMISPYYTLGEKMEKAALNTLLGMGTVFIVLILIMLIIMAFGVIPKIEKSIADKKAKKKSKTDVAVDNTIAQIIEKEELSDDTELVAVIAAAIAASEGAAGTDGFVVRSIKRANTNKWQRA
ncbi:MAG: OadG family protein [Lachnospiraceae bacterium]|nr:OadG family protein [Lachnospiraceae bacterium]